MLLPSFEYRVAESVRDAIGLWASQPGARYLAGGTDLLPQLRTRIKASLLIDLKGIAELRAIREEADGGIAVGAGASLDAIASHPAIRAHFPVLVQCIEEVGAWPLRHRATMAGNVCNASPAADTAVALLALEARLRLAGREGERQVSAGEFFVGPGKTVLQPGELVTEIVLPAASADLRGRYLRLSRRKGMDLATVGVLAGRSPNDGFRVALAAVAPTPLRVREAEALLQREGLGEGLIRAAAAAVEACHPISDVRGSAEYRREMVGVLLQRALAELN